MANWVEFQSHVEVKVLNFKLNAFPALILRLFGAFLVLMRQELHQAIVEVSEVPVIINLFVSMNLVAQDKLRNHQSKFDPIKLPLAVN